MWAIRGCMHRYGDIKEIDCTVTVTSPLLGRAVHVSSIIDSDSAVSGYIACLRYFPQNGTGKICLEAHT